MADDERKEIRSVNWGEVFSFTHIFKGFKMAVHPAKLGLTVLAIILVFATGWVMDTVWSVGGGYALPEEIKAFATIPSARFDIEKEDVIDGRLAAAVGLKATTIMRAWTLDGYRPVGMIAAPFGAALAEANKGGTAPTKTNVTTVIENAKKNGDSWSGFVSDAESAYSDGVDKIEDLLEKAEEKAAEAIEKNAGLSGEGKDEAYEKLAKDYDASWQSLTRLKVSFKTKVMDIRGTGISSAVIAWETACIANAIDAVWKGNIRGGLSQFSKEVGTAGKIPACKVEIKTGIATPDSKKSTDGTPGFIYWILMACVGIKWLIVEHWVYAAIYLVAVLAITAIFGGAVHRIAALHFTRNEKISVGQALKFSISKFLSFFSAPLIPIAIILLLGALMCAGGLLANIPFVGPIIMGVLFFLAIIAGLLVACLAVGLLAGGSLMYPTIAVEGSDSFDAISRSFAYIFTKPWRSALYGFVALIYGTITYLFVRFFAFVALSATHCFVKWGVFTGGHELAPGADKLDGMWAAPSFWSLMPNVSWNAINFGESIGAIFVWVWVFLVAATVAAYLLSYFASTATSIYCLLRKQVDATDLDDVYIEEEPEDDESFEAEESDDEESSDDADDKKEDDKSDEKKDDDSEEEKSEEGEKKE